MLTAIRYKNLSACQLVNSLSPQKLTSVNPLFIGLYLTCQLVTLKFKTDKLRAFIHALVSLSLTLIYIYKCPDKALYYIFRLQLTGGK